jgi:hypothetical protein
VRVEYGARADSMTGGRSGRVVVAGVIFVVAISALRVEPSFNTDRGSPNNHKVFPLTECYLGPRVMLQHKCAGRITGV